MRKLRLLLASAVLAVLVAGGQAPARSMTCGVKNILLNQVVCDTVFRSVTPVLAPLCTGKTHICLG